MYIDETCSTPDIQDSLQTSTFILLARLTKVRIIVSMVENCRDTDKRQGGATPIAHSQAVFERVLAEIPKLVEGIKQRGLGMKMVFRAPGSEGEHNGFNWAGEYSFGQEFQ